jgi:hypothetical protein
MEPNWPPGGPPKGTKVLLIAGPPVESVGTEVVGVKWSDGHEQYHPITDLCPWSMMDVDPAWSSIKTEEELQAFLKMHHDNEWN